MVNSRDEIAGYFLRSREAIERAAADPELMAAVAQIAGRIAGSFRAGGKLLLAGNGGSAADAQHIAAEFLSRFKLDRTPLPAIALTTDTSVPTAGGHDYGFAQVSERQVRGLGRPADVFIPISSSRRSPNVLLALKAAREIGVVTVGFTGAAGGAKRALCDVVLAAASEETALIQQVHITAAHAICGL